MQHNQQHAHPTCQLPTAHTAKARDCQLRPRFSLHETWKQTSMRAEQRESDRGKSFLHVCPPVPLPGVFVLVLRGRTTTVCNVNGSCKSAEGTWGYEKRHVPCYTESKCDGELANERNSQYTKSASSSGHHLGSKLKHSAIVDRGLQINASAAPRNMVHGTHECHSGTPQHHSTSRATPHLGQKGSTGGSVSKCLEASRVRYRHVTEGSVSKRHRLPDLSKSRTTCLLY